MPIGRASLRRRRLAGLAHLQRDYPLAQLVALVAIFLYGQATVPGFSSRLSIDSMLVLGAFLGIAAAGQTLVLLVGGIDFSIPALIVAGATMTVQLSGADHWPFPAILALIAVCSLAVGGASGYLSHRFRIQPLIVTLGVGSIVNGLILVWSNTGLVSATPPAWLVRFASPSGRTLGTAVPPVAVLWLAIAIALGVLLHKTVAGRRLYATGSNPRAAELALVRTRVIWMATFSLSALSAALVGVLLAGFAGTGESSIGDPYLWESLTAVIIGGTAFGARGDYWRTVLGTLILTELTTVLVGHGASAADQQMLSGGLILVVVALYGRDRRVRDLV